MNLQLLLVALVAVVVTGSATWSSPMSAAGLLTLGSGEPAWQVQCHGWFASGETCMKRARSICEQESVTVRDPVDTMPGDDTDVTDPRELTFVCGDVAAGPLVAARASRDAAANPPGSPARTGQAALDSRNAGHAGSTVSSRRAGTSASSG
ncbi:hypothetical protein QCE63_12825 [Caballeronia sp. LZ065]|uniref:hypothetical protein n=1 Tax=Caballeronia sp. LZ065 TaxID=3038571 RepID=UPI002862FE00|nr:hypothetical protein [Caballeronia sp. LZ065]MDR5780304.1 hypothetical protein [Caballeronia sp. LZ065]